MPSRSNGEAEYKALANATIEIMWIRILLKELEVQSPKTLHMWYNNTGAKYLFCNPIFRARTKHIKVGCYFTSKGL